MNKQSRKLKIVVVFCIFFLIFGFISTNSQIFSVYANSENYIQSTPQINTEERAWSTTEAIALGSDSGHAYVYSSEIDDYGNLHVFWSIHSDEIYYKIWFAEDQTWSSDELIVSENYYDYSSTIDSNNNLYLGWSDSIGYKYIYRNASTGIWSTPETIATTWHTMFLVELAIDNYGTLHFLWEDTCYFSATMNYDTFLFYKKRYSNGTLTSSITIDSRAMNPYPISYYRFDVCTDNDANVRIIHTYSIDIYVRSWEYATKTWSGDTKINPSYPNQGDNPTLIVDFEGNVHCTWESYTNNYLGSGGDSDIFHRFLNKTSQVWSSVSVVSTESTGNSIFPSVAVDIYGNLHVAWQDYSVLFDSGSESDILYKSWSYANQTWSTSEFVSSEGAGDSIQPIIEVDKSVNIHCLWIDNSIYGGGTSYYNVFYKNKFLSDKQLVLAVILPNPNYNGTINLDWSTVGSTHHYNVYRSTSFIFAVHSPTPIANVTISNYQDTISSNGIYYYIIEAIGSYGTKLSQCEYVEVLTPSLTAPQLLLVNTNPNPAIIDIFWNDIDEATEYYIFRENTAIWTIEGLTPIATVASTLYIDNLPAEGVYFYVVVATDGIRNSTVSNCEWVSYQIVHVQEYISMSTMLIGLVIVSIITIKARKNKLK